jgi:VIT1/CCC1 family predicted Fe2+/Mn2+ transporter
MREAQALRAQPDEERQELASIYEGRGLPRELASQVADALMRHDVLETHARDELGMSETSSAKSLQAAIASAVTFVTGGPFH